jgi:hypothetical protein
VHWGKSEQQGKSQKGLSHRLIPRTERIGAVGAAPAILKRCRGQNVTPRCIGR